MEEMGKRSDRHIRDLVAHTAFKGLDANEIGVRGATVIAAESLIQRATTDEQTSYLQAVISDLQGTAGPHRCATAVMPPSAR